MDHPRNPFEQGIPKSMAQQLLSPILVIAYRRPEKLLKVLEAISSGGPRSVYLFCDGPDSLADQKAQSAIARAVEVLGDGFTVETHFEPKHLGLKRAVTAALDWFFSLESAGIILEDDIVPTPDFLSFCDGALEHFRPNKVILQISGSNPFGNYLEFSKRHFLSTRMTGWGWATWNDRWHDFRSSGELQEMQVDRTWAPSRVVHEIEIGHKRAQSGELDTWDYTWAWYALSKKRLCLVSKVNLTRNIGFDGSATHTRSGRALTTGDLRRPTNYPVTLSPDRVFDLVGQLVRAAELSRARLDKRVRMTSIWLTHVWRRFLSPRFVRSTERP